MAKILTLLCLGVCALFPSVISQCNLQRAQPLLKRAAYEFAAQLTTRIAQEKENHFVVSTLSIWSLLATASLGAEGTTLDEFRKVLRLHRQRCFNDKYFELVKPTSTDGNVTIERSTSIFVADGLRVQEDFKQKVRTAGVSELIVLPFDDSDVVASTVSSHVSRATHNTINDLVVPGDLEGVYLIMVDALYFKGLWQTPFPYENTEVKPFYDDYGSQVGAVEMMRVQGNFNMSTIDLVGATVVALPFGADARYVMLVFVPLPEKTLSEVIDNLMKISLTTIYVIFAQDYMQTVSVEIPKFEISSDLDNLKELLSDMGLRSAFDSYAAEFPSLAEDSLYISNIVQKASIDVSEEGAEASAATAGFFGSRSGPIPFRADKPFLYMIVDTVTEVPLFTGAYSKVPELL